MIFSTSIFEKEIRGFPKRRPNFSEELVSSPVAKKHLWLNSFFVLHFPPFTPSESLQVGNRLWGGVIHRKALGVISMDYSASGDRW